LIEGNHQGAPGAIIRRMTDYGGKTAQREKADRMVIDYERTGID
jgi:hypothetical protein